MNRTFRTIALTAFALGITAVAIAQELKDKVEVSVSWKPRGGDVPVTVTLKNTSGKKCADPVVRVTFYNAKGEEVSTDAKAYFTTINDGATKKMETRIWSDVDSTAVTAKGSIDAAVFK